MYQCNKNYCQSAYTKARLSYNYYAVNTSVAVQQCDLYRTSSIFKVGLLRIAMPPKYERHNNVKARLYCMRVDVAVIIHRTQAYGQTSV